MLHQTIYRVLDIHLYWRRCNHWIMFSLASPKLGTDTYQLMRKTFYYRTYIYFNDSLNDCAHWSNLMNNACLQIFDSACTSTKCAESAHWRQAFCWTECVALLIKAKNLRKSCIPYLWIWFLNVPSFYKSFIHGCGAFIYDTLPGQPLFVHFEF